MRVDVFKDNVVVITGASSGIGEVMTAEECARIILESTAKRKREEVMGFRGKVGQWIKLIAPGLVDRIALRAIERGK